MVAQSPATQQIRVRYSNRLLPAERSALGFLLIAIACWLFAATIAIFVITQAAWLASSDLAIDTPLQAAGVTNAWLGDWALAWQYLGSSAVTGPLIVLMVVVLLVVRRPGWAGYLAACAIGGLLIAEIIKRTVGRARPTWEGPLFTEVGGSFPSGHTMVGVYGFAVLGIISIYLVKRPWGTALGWLLIIFGISMGPSRLVLGVHWPSDVVVGWMLALGWVLVVSAVSLFLTYRRQQDKPATSVVEATA